MSSYLITGAAGGIGFEFVRQLSATPENTIFALVRSKSSVNKIEALNAKNVHVVEADIVDTKALKAVASDVSKVTGGSLDYLINNAAFWEMVPGKGDLSAYAEEKELEDDLRHHFDVNVIGVIHTINIFLPLLSNSPIKKIVTLTSFGADLDFVLTTDLAAFSPYAISKAALNMAIAKYAIKYKAEGFIFISLSPGFVNTRVVPPPNHLDPYTILVNDFKKYKPTYEGPITPEESVKLQLQVIYSVSIKDTGAFLSQFGNKQWI